MTEGRRGVAPRFVYSAPRYPPAAQCCGGAPFTGDAAPFCGVAIVGCDGATGATAVALVVVVWFGVPAAEGAACTEIAGAAGAVGTLIVPFTFFFCFAPIVWRASRVASARATASAFSSTVRTGAFGGGKPKSCAC